MINVDREAEAKTSYVEPLARIRAWVHGRDNATDAYS